MAEGEAPPRFSRKKVLATIAIVVAISAFAYYEYSAYEGAIVQTSVVTGKVTAVNNSSSAPAGPGLVPSMSSVTVTIGSSSVSQFLLCSPAPYRVGQSVQVADQLLRSGQHQYAPDVACRGAVSPFKSVMAKTTTTSSGQT